MADNDAAIDNLLEMVERMSDSDFTFREFIRWTKVCVACKEEAESLTVTAPCGHTYCGECVNQYFLSAAKHEYNPRPSCCRQPITLETARSLLSSDILEMFQAKSEEISTANRTYCWDPECATFISPKSTDGRQARCPACQKSTCSVCKKEVHEKECFKDLSAQTFTIAAAEAGFKLCPKCKRMIERDEGCELITCICGTEFCYKCGDNWWTCTCSFGRPDPVDQDEEN